MFITCLPHLSLLQGMDVALFKEAYEGLKFDFLLSHAAYCRDVLKLKKGQRAVISNGRVSSHNQTCRCSVPKSVSTCALEMKS